MLGDGYLVDLVIILRVVFIYLLLLLEVKFSVVQQSSV